MYDAAWNARQAKRKAEVLPATKQPNSFISLRIDVSDPDILPRFCNVTYSFNSATGGSGASVCTSCSESSRKYRHQPNPNPNPNPKPLTV